MASCLFLTYVIFLLSFHLILLSISTISLLVISALSYLSAFLGCRARCVDLVGRLSDFSARQIRSARLDLVGRPQLSFLYVAHCHYTPGQLLMRAYRELLCTIILVIFEGFSLLLSKITPGPVRDFGALIIESTNAAAGFMLSLYQCMIAIGSILTHIKTLCLLSLIMKHMTCRFSNFYTTCVFSSGGRSRSNLGIIKRFISRKFPLLSELKKAYIRLLQIITQEIFAAQSILDPFDYQNFIFWKKEGLSSIRNPSNSMIHFIDIIKGLIKGVNSSQIIENPDRFQFQAIISYHKALYNSTVSEEGRSIKHGKMNRKCKYRKLTKKN